MPRILHITDLHGVNRTKGPWREAFHRLEGKVDFIVVSGDVAHAGKGPTRQDAAVDGEDEYGPLLRLFREEINPLLTHADDLARVIFVPGNHDLDRDVPIGGAPSLDAATLQRARREYQRSPETSGFRFGADADGLEHALQIDGQRYHRRFAAFQHFLERFYAGALGRSPHRAFELESPDPQEHWSAHVFRDQEIAFIGLNSCAYTDRFWTGAGIHRDAIHAAAKHIRRHAQGLVTVGVWHHGLFAERGRPDYVTVPELGSLKNAGLDVGIHGHTHRDEQIDLVDLLDEPFPVIATGSLGAPARERPGGVANQFSLIEVDPVSVRWDLFAFDEAANRWGPPRSRLYRARPSLRVAPPTLTRARRHTRRIRVDSMGIANVQIHLEEVHLAGDLVLACPSPGFNQMLPEENVRATQRETKVHTPPAVWKERGSPCTYRIRDDGEEFDSLDWEYEMSNAFALTNADTRMGTSRSADMVSLDPGADAYLYQVQFAAQELELSLELAGATVEKATVVAQYRTETPQCVTLWRDDTDEVRRLTASIEDRGGSQRVVLKVPHPHLGHRYGFEYRVAARPGALSDDEAVALEGMLARCRAGGSEAATLSAALIEGVNFSLAKTLSYGPSRGAAGQHAAGPWLAHLWSHRRKALVSAFGQSSREEWEASFAYGEGITGHAFRFGGPAVYHRVQARFPRGADIRRTGLLYRPRRGDVEAGDHVWIVSVPIHLSPGGPAVGVVGFARRREETGRAAAQLHLGKLAEQIVRDGDEAAPERAVLDTLSSRVSYFFWQALQAHFPFAKSIWAGWNKTPDEPSLRS